MRVPTDRIFAVTERRLRLSQILSLVFVGAIFAFAMVISLPGDDGLLTDNIVQPPEITQASWWHEVKRPAPGSTWGSSSRCWPSMLPP
jgi:hypothetical protein